MRPYGAIAQPWADAEIKILFCGYSQTASEQRPSDRIPIKTAADGSWFVDLWTNELGDYLSYYLFQFPHTKDLKLILPNGLPPENEFSGLLLNSTPPSAPEYAGLLQLVRDYLGTASLGTADQILLNPAIAGLGTTAQSALAQVAPKEFSQITPSGEWLWNHNLGYRPKAQIYNLAYQKIDAEVQHVSVNQIRVRVLPPMPGYIII